MRKCVVEGCTIQVQADRAICSEHLRRVDPGLREELAQALQSGDRQEWLRLVMKAAKQAGQEPAAEEG